VELLAVKHHGKLCLIYTFTVNQRILKRKNKLLLQLLQNQKNLTNQNGMLNKLTLLLLLIGLSPLVPFLLTGELNQLVLPLLQKIGHLNPWVDKKQKNGVIPQPTPPPKQLDGKLMQLPLQIVVLLNGELPLQPLIAGVKCNSFFCLIDRTSSTIILLFYSSPSHAVQRVLSLLIPPMKENIRSRYHAMFDHISKFSFETAPF